MTLQHRLLRANIIQMIAIAIATLLGVFIAAAVLKHVLLRTALVNEADFYWKMKEVDSDHMVPHTLNMIGYLEDLKPSHHEEKICTKEGSDITSTVHTQAVLRIIPPHLQGLKLGYHNIPKGDKTQLVYISASDTEKLYLIIDEEQITELSFFFGVIPLVLSLAGLYLLSWFTQRLVVSTVSPISKLAIQLEKTDVNTPTILEIPDSMYYQDTELMTLYQESQRLLDRAHHSVAREKRFSRDASHELRTPLAVIQGSLEIMKKMLEQHAEPNPKLQRSVLRAYTSTENMGKLLEELLLLAREDFAQLPLQEIDCNALVQEVADEVRAAFINSKVQMIVLQDEEWSTQTSLSALKVVITNIATNAMRYTEHGQVTIRTEKGIFEIGDTGIGFNPEFLQHAFQPFSRGHHENTKGFGLGLSIAKRFCDIYGWQIKLDSTPGKGSVFQILI